MLSENANASQMTKYMAEKHGGMRSALKKAEEHDEFEGKNTELIVRIRTIEGELEESSMTLKVTNDELHEVRDERDELELKCAFLEMENNELSVECENYKTENASLKTENRNLKEANQALLESNQTLLEYIDRQEEVVAEMKAEKEKMIRAANDKFNSLEESHKESNKRIREYIHLHGSF